MRSRPIRAAFPLLLLLLLVGGELSAQVPAPAAAPAPTSAEPPRDPLGRDTPRGTVLGFLNAARESRDEITPLYLDTPLRGPAGLDLARQLFVVLDRRLPARLNELSDRPEGSLANPLKPNLEVVGTIPTGAGPLDVVVERVSRGAEGPIWLFSQATLDAIPDAYEEVDLVSFDRFVPSLLTKTRIGGIRLLAWLGLGLLLPLSYRTMGAVGRPFGPVILWWRRRRGQSVEAPSGRVPGPIRLLLLAVVIRWLLGTVDVPLLERQFWTSIEALLVIAAAVWLVLRLNVRAERYVYARTPDATRGEVAALLRLARRVADVLVLAAGGLVMLHYFGIDPTAALAGLGIGGIAVALSAQKTLENVVGGLSIIFDRAVQVGDFIRCEGTLGSVEYIGLRSTRIRTLDRTILGVPNGQLANVSVETFSVRDKFWFRHIVGLRFGTTSVQMRSILAGIRDYVAAHPRVDRNDTIRARFIRVGPSSLDVEVIAYVLAADWDRFLDIQQELLIGIMALVEEAGTSIALPSQTLYVAEARGVPSVARPADASAADALHGASGSA
jgi:MscS family membrane protein